MAKSLRLIATEERGQPRLDELEASFGMMDAIVALNAGKRQVDYMVKLEALGEDGAIEKDEAA
jgi:hypothetical protein